MDPIIIILLILNLISSSVFMFFRVKQGGKRALFLKMVASMFFVLTGMYLMTIKAGLIPAVLIVLGQICGLIGDIMLDLKVIYPQDNNFYLRSGFLFFGIGHICYYSSIIYRYVVQEVSVLNVCLISLGIGFLGVIVSIIGFKVLKFKTEDMTIPSLVYSFCLATIAGASLCYMIRFKKNYLFFIGITLFLLSDVVLSSMYFKDKQDNKPMCIINHTLYYLGQILIALSIYFM